jgi:membrane fusion protein, type I secretion system
MSNSAESLSIWQRDVPNRMRRPLILGLVIVALWAGGFGIWAASAPLEGAVITSGSFVATGQNKQVQHLEGGIIRDILVREGDTVEPGQPLVRLDETAAEAKLRRLVLREYRYLTAQARLVAQIRSQDSFSLPKELAENDDPEIGQIYARQQMELKAYRKNKSDQEKVLRKEIAALKQSIIGYEAQSEAVQRRLALFSEELDDKEALLDRKLARKTDVMALRRAEADMAGSHGEMLSRIADSRERISRAEQQIAELKSAARRTSIEELRETETELDDVREQISASRDVADRTQIRAPQRGIVVRVNYHTTGAVVAPGAVILELLPVDDQLVIEGRIKPSDISHVQNGQSALVRLTALNKRLTPVIEGTVVYLSADAIADRLAQEQTAAVAFDRQSYIVRVKLDEADVRSKIGAFRPTPGMPADLYIKTGERTFAEYMLRPLLDSFSRAFREH